MGHVAAPPLDLARAWLDHFCAGRIDALAPLLADDLVVDGPFHHSTSAADYLAALRADPPRGLSCRVLHAFEAGPTACLVYRLAKDGVDTPVAQVFETGGGRIGRITLVFDSAPFVREAPS